MDWARLRRLLLLLPTAACAWSVQVEPLKAAGPSPAAAASPAPGETLGGGDPEARALYVSHCGRCHDPFPPTHAPAKAWPRLVAKYGPRAQLFGEDRARVLLWLRSQAR